MSVSKKDWREVRNILDHKLDFDGLRPGQREALEAVLEGHDTLAVLPTGSGKSAIYQIAGMLIPGPTVVVSPLIALQRDQRDAITEGDLGHVAVVNSMQRSRERDRAFEELENSELEFLLLAPEQFSNAETLEHLRAAKPSLFVVDEAHCVSEWGHSFRPDYLRLGSVIDALGHPRVLALTATASADVRQEICERLHMRLPVVIVTGIDRPNIHLSVSCLSGERLKLSKLLELLDDLAKPGIVYVGTRRHAEEVAQALVEHGQRAVAYHAGMKRDERNARQNAFMNDEAEIIVATSAFGMGIDKPNVRFVVHYDVSESLDAYYQEIGRAGRDGEPARAVLLYSEQDLGLKRFFLSGGRLTSEDIESIIGVLRHQEIALPPAQLAKLAGLSRSKTSNAIARLEDRGAIMRGPTGEVLLADPEAALTDAIQTSVTAQAALRARQQARVEPMQQYARTRDCRRQVLLNHFGDLSEVTCSGCDICDARTRPQSAASASPTAPPALVQLENAPFGLESRVSHKAWGKGTVLRYENPARPQLVVAFDHSGEHHFVVEELGEGAPLVAAS